jgi:long-chain-fatty-acid--[acyl-carrier-protein] ligase
MLPILSGMRSYFAPDPNDHHGMARDIATWHATLFCCAPTFIKGLFHAASHQQLDSLRYIVSGAEKAPRELFDYVEKLGGDRHLIEGYGITECGPVVTITRLGAPRNGVGLPLPGVDLCVIDSETHEVLPQGKEGEICIRGPNVFSGYLGTQRSPFITLEGKEWYRSGDRGLITESGTLALTGRIKRFVKVGGEMISLGGLEEELIRLAQEKKWPISEEIEGPPLAVGVTEYESGRPEIILFTTFEISKEEVNTALRECGYGRIVKIAAVRKLDQIPVTGTGKTHYRALDELIA